MSKSFFQGSTAYLRWGALGFLIAAIGAGLGFLGFALEERAVSLVGFWVCSAGVLLGSIAVVVGIVKWLKHPKQNLSVSIEAGRQLRSRFIKGRE